MPIEVTRDDIRYLRIIAGFVIAPALPALPLLSLCIVDRDAWRLAAILATIGYEASLFIGLPMLILANKRGINRLRAYALGSFSIGSITGLLLAYMTNASTIGQFAITAFVGAIYGVLAGIAFWFVVGRKASDTVPD